MEESTSDAEEKRYAELQLMALDDARHGETKRLLSVVRAGMPVNLEDAKGNTLLMLAAYNGHLGTTHALLQAGADVDRRNHRGQTPLGGAAFKGDTAIAARLLDAGADINANNGNGMTPLMFAAMFGRTRVVELLRKRGADAKARNRYGFSAAWLQRVAPLVAGLMKFAQRRRVNKAV